jgi:hypothetical protein
MQIKMASEHEGSDAILYLKQQPFTAEAQITQRREERKEEG